MISLAELLYAAPSYQQNPLWPAVGGHEHCNLGAFCRNPLHPGPCKGWKKHLGLVAPGALHALERVRHDKLEAARKAKVKALQDAGKPVPKKLLQPIVYDPAKNKHLAGISEADKQVLEPPHAPTKKQIETKLADKHAAEAAKKAATPEKPGWIPPDLLEAAVLNVAHGKTKIQDQPSLNAISKMPKAQFDALPGPDRAAIIAHLSEIIKNNQDDDPDTANKAADLLEKLSPTPDLTPSEKGDKTKIAKIGDLSGAQKKAAAGADSLDKINQMAIGKKLNEGAKAKLAMELTQHDEASTAKAQGFADKYAKNVTNHLAAKTKKYTQLELTEDDKAKVAEEVSRAILGDTTDTPILDAMKKSWQGSGPGTGPLIKALQGEPAGPKPALPPKHIQETINILGGKVTTDKASLEVFDKITPEEFHSLDPDVQGALIDDLTEIQKVHANGPNAQWADQAAEIQAKLTGLGPVKMANPPDKLPTPEPLPVDMPTKLSPPVPDKPFIGNVKQGKAIMLATGQHSGTAKMKLAAYEDLTAEDFQAMKPEHQKAILADLDVIHGKFLDPKKKQAVEDVKIHLSKAAGGGAGAGGTPDTTAPDQSLGAITDHAMKAKIGSENVAKIAELAGVKSTPTMKDATEKVIKKTLDNGTEGALEAHAQGMATSLTGKLKQNGGLAVDTGDAYDMYHQALTAEIHQQMLASSEPTPVLDAYKHWTSLNAAPDASVIEKSQAKTALEEAVGQWHEHHSMGGAELTAAQHSYEQLKQHAHSQGGFTQPDLTTAQGAKSAAVSLAVDHTVTALSSLGLSGMTNEWTAKGFQKKLSDALTADYQSALLNHASKPGGLAAELDKIAADTNAKGEALATTNGWAKNSFAVAGWKQAYFENKIDDFLAGAGVGKPAGAGGTSAVNAVPDEVKSVITSLSTSGKKPLSAGAKTSILAAYKGMTGSYLSDSPEQNYANLLAITTALSGQKGYGKLSLGQALQAIDEQMASNLGVANTHALENKIRDWLATPGGKLHAQGAKADPVKVSQVVGTPAKATAFKKLAAGKKVQAVGGPGKYTAKSDGDFQSYSNHTTAASQSQQLKAMGKVLTQQHLNAISTYTGSSYDLNDYLRKDSYHFNAGHTHTAQLLQDAMIPFEEDTHLIRRTDWGFLPPEYQTLEGVKKLKGKTYKDGGFLSTTLAADPGQYGHGYPVVLEIQAPKGTKGLYVEPYTSVSGEHEMILSAGNVYRVLDAWKGSDGKFHVKVRVVTPK